MEDPRNNIMVSISCLTYNHAPYIRQCLDGFFMQQCDFDFEVLIHDDASTDGTVDIIKEYQQKYPDIIKPFFQNENQWSKGIRGMNQKFNYPRAAGKYIALCEGDDYWTDPLKLQKQVDFLEENEEYILTSHFRSIVNERNEVISGPDRLSLDHHTQCLVFKNVLKDDFLLYDSSYITNGDSFLILYLSNFGKSEILKFNGASYRVSDSGIWSKISKIERFKLVSKSYESMMHFFSSHNYKDSVRTIKLYILDLEISVYKSRGHNTFRSKLKLLIKSIFLGDIKRLKSVLMLYAKN